tara:strand:+ start:473 stop:652 length:180 start_codon:yes stop_codon:yes gene_type:complete
MKGETMMDEQFELNFYDDGDYGGINTDSLPYDDVADKSDLWELLKPIGTMGDYRYNGDS